MRTSRSLLLSSLLTLIFCGLSYSQYIPRGERGDPLFRMRTDISGNRVLTSAFNFGFTGRTGLGAGIPYEWPAGTLRQYIALSTIFIGGEVVDEGGETIHIVSVPAYRANLVNGLPWTFQPVPQYSGSTGAIARSDDPATWPQSWPDKMDDPTDPGWPGSWNGLLGKNVLIDGVELYYHYADDLYDRYNFFPDSTDPARRGLGIVVSERVLEFAAYPVEDALFVVSDIYNAGTSDIERAAVTLWIADFVGGDGDTQDDIPMYNLADRLIYLNDLDGHSDNPAFLNARVGTPTLALVEVPDNLGFTSVVYAPSGSINFSTFPDEWFWQYLMSPGFFSPPPSPGENDIFASCGFFSLAAGSSTRLITVWVFAEDSLNGKRKASYARSFAGAGYSIEGTDVSILSPTGGEVVSNPVNIEWNAEGNDPALTVDLFFSSDYGSEWVPLASGEQNDGYFEWRVDSLRDGIFYSLLAIAYDSTRIGTDAMEETFIVNTSAPAAPEIRLLSPQAGGVYMDETTIEWLGGDADGDSVSIELSYRPNPSMGWVPFASGIANTGSFAWNTVLMPNGTGFWLKSGISDGVLSGADSSGPFGIDNPRYGLDDSADVIRATTGTGSIEPHIVDSTQLTGHRYRVEFSLSVPESVTTYDVIDEYTGLTVVNDATQVTGETEGPFFDGIRMLIQNDSLGLDVAHSGWNHSGIYDYQFSLFRFGFQEGFPHYGNYAVAIAEVGEDTSETIVLGTVTFPARPVNFHVMNLLTGDRMSFGFVEIDGSDGRFTARVDGSLIRSDKIVLLTQDSGDSVVFSWGVSMNPLTVGGNPVAGDSLHLFLFKPFLNGDTYAFDALLGPILGLPEIAISDFSLFQNFPNPFNPSTQIRFSLGRREHVVLEVFDILGRRVRTLVSEFMEPGTRSVIWDGTNDQRVRVSSGVYLYRIIAGDFVQTRKLLLLQ
jgi:hypothetical protein